MPHQLFDRDYFGAFFQQIRGEGVTQRVTAGFDARSLCVSFNLLLNPFGRKRAPRSLPIPEEQIVRHGSWP